jgi:deoxycytidylate deaminase
VIINSILKGSLHCSLVCLAGKSFSLPARNDFSGGRFISGTRVISRSTHAEINALKSVPWDILFSKRNKVKRLIVYVVRYILLDGELVLSNSKPCYNCLKIINCLGIDRIVYSTDKGSMKKDSVKNLLETEDYIISKGDLQ